MSDFQLEVSGRIEAMAINKELKDASAEFMRLSTAPKYSYNFSWCGRPIIQYPQDIIAMQEIIWRVRPDLIIETGIAHGGSLIFSAAMLAQLDMCDAIESGVTFDPQVSARKVVGIDIDIRAHNRQSIMSHPMYSRIQMIEGSSIDPRTISQVHKIANDYNKILVCLDSNHTSDHVLSELHAYAPLTSLDSYCIVFDTIIEEFPENMYPDRTWGPGNNPKTAVFEYLKTHAEFQIDSAIHNKLLITVAPQGYLRRVSV